MKRHVMQSGDTVSIDWRKQVVLFECCDCGLSHAFGFELLDNGKLQIQVVVDEKATSRARKKRKSGG